MLDTIRGLGPSIVRTVTPMVVGLLVTLGARAGLEWEPSAEVTAIVSTVVASAWYAFVRLLETRGADAWGKLLGSTQQPVYTGAHRDEDGDGTPDQDPASRLTLPEDTVQRGIPASDPGRPRQ